RAEPARRGRDKPRPEPAEGRRDRHRERELRKWRGGSPDSFGEQARDERQDRGAHGHHIREGAPASSRMISPRSGPSHVGHGQASIWFRAPPRTTRNVLAPARAPRYHTRSYRHLRCDQSAGMRLAFLPAPLLLAAPVATQPSVLAPATPFSRAAPPAGSRRGAF